MIYGYCRVSTKGQLDGNGLDVQKQEILKEYPHAEIIEEQFSGKTTDRPRFHELISKLQKGDKLVVTKLDRFARNTEQGLKLMRELLDKDVAVEVLNFGGVEGGFNSKNKLMFSVLLAFAEFERDLIVERTRAGKEIARQNPDFREGRPVLHKREKVNHALDLIEAGNSYKKVAAMMGMSESTLYRAMRRRRAEKLKD